MYEELKNRHLNLELYNSVVVDEENELTYFLMYNLSGQLLGFTKYNPNGDKKVRNNPKEGKYYTICTKDTLAVWGVETLYFRKDILCVTEGIFDACRLHNLGLPAVATMSNNPKHIKSWLHSLNRKIVAFCDGDSAGRYLAKYGDEAVFLPEGRDLGDLSNDEVTELASKYL